ncbi:reverse transcriptase zinc-binding domain-containing protein [Artemisia annua]|uniref:Reverse transcriptase zinc-binding domain-containing protein n=1 Tax=Artemisia annua TaxID=35608 RepID=A0A2U1M0R2_ARTAN|nr:reverse transcriptase zinc-binding domain-containing protein [Artemisia annua]
MIKKLGNGANTFVVFDNWCSLGILQSFINYRDIYNARLEANVVVRDIVRNGRCQWPDEWIGKYPDLSQIHEVEWKVKEGKFSVKQAYIDLSGEEEMVKWCKPVWFSQNIPKHAFILWLAIQNKLTTQDKIRSWGSCDMMVCTLCYSDGDSHQHLFFKCKYANQFWNKVKDKLGIQCDGLEWNEIVNWCAELCNGNTIVSVVRRIGLAASVYYIWQERNWRLFKGVQRSTDELISQFNETVKLRLLSLKVKHSVAVVKVQNDWNITWTILVEVIFPIQMLRSVWIKLYSRWLFPAELNWKGMQKNDYGLQTWFIHIIFITAASVKDKRFISLK